MVDEHILTPLQRYQNYVELLKQRVYDSEESASAEIRLSENEEARFLINLRQGTYIACRAYLSRDGNVTVSQMYSFLLCDVHALRNQVAQSLGLELLEDYIK